MTLRDETENARRVVLDKSMHGLAIGAALDALVAAVRAEGAEEIASLELSLRIAEELRERIGTILGRKGTPRENGWAATESTVEVAERVMRHVAGLSRALDDREAEVLMLAAELDELHGPAPRDALDLAKQRAAGLRRLLERLEPK